MTRRNGEAAFSRPLVRKRAQALGDIHALEGAGAGDLKLAEREAGDYPGTPKMLDAEKKPAAPPKPVGPRTWVEQGGEWFYKWRTGDSWWELAVRYLGDGKRHKEIWAYQTEAFRQRVPTPVAIYTHALVRMPPEAVVRANALGDIHLTSPPATSARAASADATASAPLRPTPAANRRPAETTATTPLPTLPETEPRAASPMVVVDSSTESRSVWAPWVLGGFGLLAVGTLGYFAYQAYQQTARDEDER